MSSVVSFPKREAPPFMLDRGGPNILRAEVATDGRISIAVGGEGAIVNVFVDPQTALAFAGAIVRLAEDAVAGRVTDPGAA